MNRCYVYAYLDPQKRGKYCYKDLSLLYEPFYIGKGSKRRRFIHLKKIINGSKYFKNGHLKNKILKILLEFSEEDFKHYIIILKEGLSDQEALDFERNLINEIGRSDLKLGPLTNHTDGGEGASNPSQETRKKLALANLGKALSFETKEKLRLANEGRKHTKETREKISQKHLGMKATAETKAKLSKMKKGNIGFFLGQKHSTEAKCKMSQHHQNTSGENNPMFGKKHSEEARRKIASAHLGKKHSQETLNKISEANRGKNNPRYGKQVSEETKQKIKLSKAANKAEELERLKNLWSFLHLQDKKYKNKNLAGKEFSNEYFAC